MTCHSCDWKSTVGQMRAWRPTAFSCTCQVALRLPRVKVFPQGCRKPGSPNFGIKCALKHVDLQSSSSVSYNSPSILMQFRAMWQCRGVWARLVQISCQYADVICCRRCCVQRRPVVLCILQRSLSHRGSGDERPVLQHYEAANQGSDGRTPMRFRNRGVAFCE